MKGICGPGELGRVLQHALAPVRADDAEGDARHVLHVVLVAAHHRAGVEGGDLVVVVVGGDERLRSEQLVDHLHLVQADALLDEMLAVGAEVLPHRGHRHRVAAQQLEVVGDVVGAAAELAAHPRDQERHVQDVHLVRQDVVLELVREHHDGVVGEGTTNQCGHRRGSGGKGASGHPRPHAGAKVTGWGRTGPALTRAAAGFRAAAHAACANPAEPPPTLGFTRIFLAAVVADC